MKRIAYTMSIAASLATCCWMWAGCGSSDEPSNANTAGSGATAGQAGAGGSHAGGSGGGGGQAGGAGHAGNAGTGGTAGGGGAGPGTATLTWNAPTTNSDGSSLTDLAGYKVYSGTSSGAYGTPMDVGMPPCQSVPPNTQCTYAVVGLASATWYFAVTAYNGSGFESTFSNEASKVVP